MSFDASVTHSMLVSAAAMWLRKKCSVVLTELVSSCSGEVPDAIGWQGTHSTLVECKVSRSDFIADKSKVFRRDPDRGIGESRFFLALRGLVSADCASRSA